MEYFRSGQIRVIVHKVTLPGSDGSVIDTPITLYVPLTATTGDIIKMSINSIRMSQLIMLNTMAVDWKRLMRSRFDGFACPFIDRQHCDIADGETAYQLFQRSLRRGTFMFSTSLSSIFVNNPFFKVFTLGDLLQCHEGTRPIYLGACLSNSLFQLYVNNRLYDKGEILTWHLSGKELCEATFTLGGKMEEHEIPMGRILNVSEEPLQGSEEEEEEQQPQKKKKQQQQEVVQVQTDPIGVVCYIKKGEQLKIAATAEQLLERVAKIGDGYFIPFRNVEDAYKFAWPLYYAGVHTRGQGKAGRMAKIILYLYYVNSQNDTERNFVGQFQSLLDRSLEISPHDVKKCAYPYLNQYVAPAKRARITEPVSDKVSQTLRKL